jgi:hypothetical protein
MTNEEIRQLRLLKEIHQKVSRHSWWSDFSSNIAGNAAWDGLRWIAKALIKKL